MRRGISILALAVFIILSVINPDLNSIGVHSFKDWMLVIVLGVGLLLWLLTPLPPRRATKTTATAHYVNA